MKLLTAFLKIFVTLICVNPVTSIPRNPRYGIFHIRYNDVGTNYEKTNEENPLIVVRKPKHAIQDVKEIDIGKVIERPLMIILKIKNTLQAKAGKITNKNVEQGHANEKMRPIINFMPKFKMTGNYLYYDDDEGQRGLRDRVDDDLRQMVSYLLEPKNADMKNSVLEYFHNKLMEKAKKTTTIWDHRVNDMVINVLQDPFNDGTIN